MKKVNRKLTPHVYLILLENNTSILTVALNPREALEQHKRLRPIHIKEVDIPVEEANELIRHVQNEYRPTSLTKMVIIVSLLILLLSVLIPVISTQWNKMHQSSIQEILNNQ